MKKFTGWITEDGVIWNEHQEDVASAHAKFLIAKAYIEEFADRNILYNEDLDCSVINREEFVELILGNKHFFKNILAGLE